MMLQLLPYAGSDLGFLPPLMNDFTLLLQLTDLSHFKVSFRSVAVIFWRSRSRFCALL